MKNNFYGSEEQKYLNQKILDEFAYMYEKCGADEKFVIEDMLVAVIQNLSRRGNPNMNHSLMMVIDRVLEDICINLREQPNYGIYISGLIQRIELAKYRY